MTIEEKIDALIRESNRISEAVSENTKLVRKLRTGIDGAIDMETAMILYTEATKVAVSELMTLFIVDIFGEEKIVKIDKKRSEATILPIDHSLTYKIVTGEKELVHFRLFDKGER